MNEDIRRYEVEPRNGMSGMNLSLDLTSFYGGKKRGRSIQFTLANGSFIALSQVQLYDLLGVIQRRLDGVKFPEDNIIKMTEDGCYSENSNV